MSLELGALVRAFGDAVRERCGGWLPDTVEKTLRAISVCRTAALGGHVFVCEACGVIQPRYNSCRNRHCPQCQGLARLKWLAARLEDTLPVPYYHVVFTLPSELQPLARLEPREIYGLLFRAAWESLRDLASDRRYLGGEIGMLAVLHTWGQQLQLHPHVHCVVPGCSRSPDGAWSRSGRRFLVPVRALSAGFRNRFIASLERKIRRRQVQLPAEFEESPSRYRAWIEGLRSRRWVVFAKRPFAGPDALLKYLARYSHRVAISNSRLLALEDDVVVYRYKQYRRGGQWQTGRLDGVEFVRRFTQHVLPRGFMRIRYYGLLSNRRRRETVAACRAEWNAAVDTAQVAPSLESQVAHASSGGCVACGVGILRRLESLPASPGLRARSPP